MQLSYTILYVEDVKKAVAFYEKAFSLNHKFSHEGGDYAEMDTGATTLAFCSHELANNIIKRSYTKASPSGPLIGSQISFSPDDVKKAYLKAIEAGAENISEPEIKPWNFEVALVRDSDGHIVELAKNLNI